MPAVDAGCKDSRFSPGFLRLTSGDSHVPLYTRLKILCPAKSDGVGAGMGLPNIYFQSALPKGVIADRQRVGNNAFSVEKTGDPNPG